MQCYTQHVSRASTVEESITPLRSKWNLASIWWHAISVLQIYKPGFSAGELSTKRNPTEITLAPYSFCSDSGWLMFATSRISLASSSVSKMATLLWWAGGSVTLAGCSWAGTEMLCSTAKGMYTDGEAVRRCDSGALSHISYIWKRMYWSVASILMW